MKRTFKIITDSRELCITLNRLNDQKRRFTVTPWSSSDGSETGFTVWYFV